MGDFIGEVGEWEVVRGREGDRKIWGWGGEEGVGEWNWGEANQKKRVNDLTENKIKQWELVGINSSAPLNNE